MPQFSPFDLQNKMYMYQYQQVSEDINTDNFEEPKSDFVIKNNIYNNWNEFKIALDNCKAVSGDEVHDSLGVYIIKTVTYKFDENRNIVGSYTYDTIYKK